jgi:hypothetical protein
MDLSKMKCKRGCSYRSPGDYVLAMRLKVDVEVAHGLMDMFEDVLDEALDYSDSLDSHLQKLKEEYGYTEQASADQEDR